MQQIVDTKITYINRAKGTIRGYLGPFGSADNLTVAGKSNIPGYRGHYLSKNSNFAIPQQGVWLNPHHHWDMGNVGYLDRLIADENGLACEGTLLACAAGLYFDKESRTLPRLLSQGKLYFCMELSHLKLAPDGELLSAVLFGVAITEHPGVAKRGAA